MGLAWLDVFEFDAPVIRPSLDRCTDVLGAVVTPNDLWLAPPGNDLPQGSDHTLGGQGDVDLDAQGFAVEVVNHVEQSEVPAIFELVCMKSMDQTSLKANGTLSGSGLSRTSRLRGLMRGFSSM